MKFDDSGSKGTRVIERKRSVTDGQTDRRTKQKQYVSPRGVDIIVTPGWGQFLPQGHNLNIFGSGPLDDAIYQR